VGAGVGVHQPFGGLAAVRQGDRDRPGRAQPQNLLDFLASTASQPARAHLPAHIVNDIAAAATAA